MAYVPSKTVFTMVLFLGLFIFFASSTILVAQNTQSFGNQTNTNLTFVNTGINNNVKLCDFQSDIPIFGGLVWGADCIADTVGTLFGYANTTSEVPLLGIILLAFTVTFLVIAIVIIRG